MMKRGAENIWYKITSYKEFPILVKKYRKLAGIPTKGVPEDKWTEFLTELSEENKIGNKQLFNNFCSYSNAFIEEIKKIFPLSETLEAELNHYFYNNEFDKNEINTTLCEKISTMKYGGIDIIFPWLKRLDKLREGVYIYIDPSSSVTMLKEFIEKNKNLIEEDLEEARKKLGLKKTKKPRLFSNKERNELIYKLGLKNIGELKEMSGDSKSLCNDKDIHISYILKKLGFKVSNDNVRTIMSRQNKLKNGNVSL